MPEDISHVKLGTLRFEPCRLVSALSEWKAL